MTSTPIETVQGELGVGGGRRRPTWSGPPSPLPTKVMADAEEMRQAAYEASEIAPENPVYRSLRHNRAQDP
jgi:hypothetical protein